MNKIFREARTKEAPPKRVALLLRKYFILLLTNTTGRGKLYAYRSRERGFARQKSGLFVFDLLFYSFFAL